MQARMKHPVFVLPDAMKALYALNAASESALPPATVKMVHLRVSQINGCSMCVDMHAHELKKLGEEDRRIWSIGAWREAPWYDDAERAALALAESLTRLADKEDAAPDPLWEEAKRHYDEKALSALLLQIAQINVWNRLNAAIRQPAGPLQG